MDHPFHAMNLFGLGTVFQFCFLFLLVDIFLQELWGPGRDPKYTPCPAKCCCCAAAGGGARIAPSLPPSSSSTAQQGAATTGFVWPPRLEEKNDPTCDLHGKMPWEAHPYKYWNDGYGYPGSTLLNCSWVRNCARILFEFVKCCLPTLSLLIMQAMPEILFQVCGV